LSWAGVRVSKSLHIFHIGHHHPDEGENHDHEHSGSGHAPYLFLFSIIGHCFASGMLLAASKSLSARIASAVFIALVAHKGYESLTVSSVLLRQVRSKAARITAIVVYSLSLPFGVAVTSFFRDQMSQEIAVFISSLAIGTLLGCLIFDFLLPSIRELKARRSQVGWLLLGLGLTQLMMKNL
jgi:zinc transporter ZupT